MENGYKFYTTTYSLFGNPQEVEVKLCFNDNNELMYKYATGLNWWQHPVEKLHSTNLYINHEVLYVKNEF